MQDSRVDELGAVAQETSDTLTDYLERMYDTIPGILTKEEGVEAANELFMREILARTQGDDTPFFHDV